MCTLGCPHNDARYLSTVTIEYPLHALFGRELTVCRRLRRGGVLFYEVQLEAWNTVLPEWMTRRDACAQLRCGVDPVCSLAALREVLALVHQRDL